MQNQYQNHQKFRIGRGVILLQFPTEPYMYVYLCCLQYASMFKSSFQSIYTTLKLYYMRREYVNAMQAQCLSLCHLDKLHFSVSLLLRVLRSLVFV